MKLCMSMVESRLSQYNKECRIQDEGLTIRGMRFLSEQHPAYSNEYIYIGQAAQYLEDPRYADALILANGKSHIVCQGSDYEDLLNDVLAVFDFFNDIEQRLVVAASKHRPLIEMMELVAEVTDDPVIVFGISGEVLAGHNLASVPSATLRENVLARGSLGADTIGSYLVGEDGEVRHDLGAEPVSMRDWEGNVGVSMYLYQDGEPIGFVMCFPSSRNGEALAKALEPLFADAFVQASEFTDARSPHQSQHLALAELVGGGIVSEEAAARLMQSIGDPARFHVVSVASLFVQNRTQRLLLMTEVESSVDECMACDTDDAVAFLVSKERLPALLLAIEARFDERSVAVGVSMSAAGISGIRSGYRQAVFARESSDGPGMRFCRDLALPFLLSTLGKEPIAYDLRHPSIAVLEEYDLANGTELLETLRAYVACGCSQSITAQRLYIHLNTLKYRIARIAELTALDLKDHEALFHVELSLRMMD